MAWAWAHLTPRATSQVRAAEQAQKARNAEFVRAVSGGDEQSRAMLQGYAPGQYVRVLLEQVPPSPDLNRPQPTSPDLARPRPTSRDLARAARAGAS